MSTFDLLLTLPRYSSALDMVAGSSLLPGIGRLSNGAGAAIKAASVEEDLLVD